MAVVIVQPIDIQAAIFKDATSPSFTKGGTIPVLGLAFDAALDEAVYFQVSVPGYGSGNITGKLWWYGDTASSGDVVWDMAIAAITPNTDSQDIETKALATATSSTDTHLGTTGQRLHEVSVAISNLDSLAVGDALFLRVRRPASSDAADTMSGDAIMTALHLEYSDT